MTSNSVKPVNREDRQEREADKGGDMIHEGHEGARKKAQ
jgi:hypothetical protein